MDDQTEPSKAQENQQKNKGFPGTSNGFPVKKRNGTENHGFAYERYMCIWMLLSLLEDTDVLEFHIVDNVEGMGVFDDIVARVKRNVPGKEAPVYELICVQVKHKQDFDKKIPWEEVAGIRKGPFHLKIYYDKYCTSKLLSLSGCGDPILEECSEENVKLVLFTNAAFAFGEDSYATNSSKWKLLKTNEPFKVSDFKDKKLNDRVWTEFRNYKQYNKSIWNDKQNVQHFLNKLIIISEQSGNIRESENKVLKTLKDKLIDKLSRLSGIEMSSDHLDAAVDSIVRSNKRWLSRDCFSDIRFMFQGVLVNWTDIAGLWVSPSSQEKKLIFMNRIIVQHICLKRKNEEVINEETEKKGNEYVCVGKPLKSSKPYYVRRMPEIEYNNITYKLYYPILSKSDSFIFPDNPEESDEEFETECHLEELVKSNASSVLDESLILLCAGPGMGKSCYFTHQAKLLKHRTPQKFVIRVNLLDFSKYLQTSEVNVDNKTAAKKFLLEIAEVKPDTAEHDLFEACLLQNKMMDIFLDGVDEISPDYYDNLMILIQTIHREFDVQQWISTRPIKRKEMEEDLQVKSYWLKEFSEKEADKFMRKYCKLKYKIFSSTNLKIRLIPICSKLIGKIINNGNVENLDDITNDYELYDKFADKMYEVYHLEKRKSNTSTPADRHECKKLKKISMENHERAALLEVFGEKKLLELNWNIRDQFGDFLQEIAEGEEKTGLIVNYVDGRPVFIHRTVAEHFCGQWFAKNHDKYHQYVEKYKVFPPRVDLCMSYKLDKSDKLFKFILLKDKREINNYSEDFVGKLTGLKDPLGRGLLYYVNTFVDYINEYLDDFELKKSIYDMVGKLMAEDMVQNSNSVRKDTTVLVNFNLLSSFFDSLDLENHPEHRPVMCYILTFVLSYLRHSIFFNRHYVGFFLLNYCKNLPLHISILRKDDIEMLKSLMSEEHINSRDNIGLTPLHLASIMGNAEAVRLLCNHHALYSRDNVLGMYPHQLSRHDVMNRIWKMFYSSFMKENDLKANMKAENYILQNLPLHDAVQKKDLNRVKMEIAGLGCVDSRGRTALHVAAALNSAANKTNSKIFAHLLKENIAYTRDEDGFYPHDYCAKFYEVGDPQCSLRAYGFTKCLASLPADKQKVFGKHIKDIVNEMIKNHYI